MIDWFAYVTPATVLSVVALILAISAKFGRDRQNLYGIWTNDGWMTGEERIDWRPEKLCIWLKTMWTADLDRSHDWVVGVVPPNAGPPKKVILEFES